MARKPFHLHRVGVYLDAELWQMFPGAGDHGNVAMGGLVGVRVWGSVGGV